MSRTFALSITLLPPGLREPVRAAYLLCRMADTIEDEPHLDPAVRGALFGALARVVAEDDAPWGALVEGSRGHLVHAPPAELELMESAGAVLEEYRALPADQRQAVRPHVLEMIRGMEVYAARGHRITDLADLERYCWFVAGTVGLLLTDLFLLRHRPRLERAELRALGEHFGLGLQLVNVLKDVAGDLERGTCFLPADLAREHQVDLDRLLDPDHREQGLALVGHLAGRAREHLEGGRLYTLAWPESASDVRLFCSVPLTLAWATLEVVERGDDTLVPGREPKVSREQVLRAVRDASQAAGSDAQLSRLLSCRSDAVASWSAERCPSEDVSGEQRW